MTFIKFCGMTREEDLDIACAIGVDAVGFVLWPQSPRHIEMSRLARLVKRLPAGVVPVGVFVSPGADEVEQARDAGVRVVQVHGSGGAALGGDLWIARHLDADVDDLPPEMTLVLDAHDPVRHGGTGRTIDWARAGTIAARRRVLLAGGLTPSNVTEAVRQVRPYGVDVASGIEERPGIKDPHAMRAFVAAVREADR